MTKNAKSSVSWSDVMQGNYGEPKITLKSGK